MMTPSTQKTQVTNRYDEQGESWNTLSHLKIGHRDVSDNTTTPK